MTPFIVILHSPPMVVKGKRKELPGPYPTKIVMNLTNNVKSLKDTDLKDLILQSPDNSKWV